MRISKQSGNRTRALCTRSEDYLDTGLHFHNIISTDAMFQYGILSTASGSEERVASRWGWEEFWFPTIKLRDWVFEEYCIAYNITDYLAARADSWI